jgi:anti-sigma factor ChrR (cupin superfamily)
MKNHPDEESLLRFCDDDLAPAEAAEIGAHIRTCEECREQLESVRETLDEYQQFHETVLKKSLEAPPRPWSAVWARRVIRFPVKRMLAAAAAVVLVVALVRRLEVTPAVKASELLRRASQAEQSAPEPHRRIRIRTGRHTWVRPARMAQVSDVSADAAEIRAMFDAAGYSLEDPLSARAFSRWRDSLADKTDRVDKTAEGWYAVTTSTPSGVLRDATLTLRARDLHPVAGTLQFRSEITIEMTELADQAGPVAEAQTKPSPPAEAAPPAIVTAPPQSGPSDELHVLAALHRIGADLGEPVEVRREGAAVVVTGMGLTPAREEQVRAAVSEIPGVQVHFEEAHSRRNSAAGETRPSSPSPNEASPNPLVAELQAKLGGNAAELSDRLIEVNDRAIERAYALRALGRRFPAAIERGLSAADRRTLAGIVSEHIEALARNIAGLRGLLNPILPQIGPDQEAPPSDWQSAAEALLVLVQTLDQMLDGTTFADAARVAEVLAQLEARIAGIGAAAREVAR